MCRAQVTLVRTRGVRRHLLTQHVTFKRQCLQLMNIHPQANHPKVMMKTKNRVHHAFTRLLALVHCIIAREGSDDEAVIYSQYGPVYDSSIPGQVAQAKPPLMIDELPSIYDENKWAVRRAGSRPDGGPYFYVNAR